MQANQTDTSVVLVAESDGDRAALAALEANELGVRDGDSLAISVVQPAAVAMDSNSLAATRRRVMLLEARKMRLSAMMVSD